MGIIRDDLTGKRFGRWTVLELGEPKGKHIRWLCKCDCGTVRLVIAFTLNKTPNPNCGCVRREYFLSTGVYGLERHPLYPTWKNMMNRCFRVTNPAYQKYGGRGITVCERWRDIRNFVEDMHPKPSPEHSVDRIDDDGPYSPENCRWATRTEQARNKRNNRLITYAGETLCASEWAERVGISPDTLYSRIKAGWTLARALSS